MTADRVLHFCAWPPCSAVIFEEESRLLTEDERRTHAAAVNELRWQIGVTRDDSYVAGQRDEREAIDAEITADLTARIQREREDRDPDLLLGGIDYALQNVLRVIRARGES